MILISRICAAGTAYRYTSRNSPDSRKKSWSSIQLALVYWNTWTASLFSPGLKNSVSSNSEGVNPSSP